MKTRKGFVSNSSSSSFIINEDMTVEQAREIMEKLEQALPELIGTWIIEEVSPYWYDEQYNGRFAVKSIGDNSIPYYLFDIIEEKLNTYRMHMG